MRELLEVVTSGFGFVTGVLLAVVGFSALIRYSGLLCRGVTVEGKVAEEKFDDDGDRWAVIEYAVGGEKYFLPVAMRTEEVGETVAVRVDPANPNKARAAGGASGGFMAVMLLLVGVGIVALSARDIKRTVDPPKPVPVKIQYWTGRDKDGKPTIHFNSPEERKKMKGTDASQPTEQK